jgi:spermidine/putrescine transport system substrate-binding protein
MAPGHRAIVTMQNVKQLRCQVRPSWPAGGDERGEQVSKSSEWDIERALAAIEAAGVSRRTLLKRSGAGALSLGVVGFLAACGGDNGGGGGAKVIPTGQIAKTLTFSNWPLYIDVKGKRHPTLDKFQKQYGTKVKYIEEINDNVEFFGKVRQQYAQGNSGGRDLHVVTDWLCNRMKQLGFVQKLDKSEMPNVVKNIEDAVASPDFDPKREVSVPWQSGQVLLIYRRDKTGGDLTSVNDLFDPKFKGKVTMLTEMRDTVGSVLLSQGIDPEKATKDQALAAIDKIEKASKDGQIRRFTGNEYTRDITKGDSVAILGWSGDAVQLTADNPNIKFKQPEDGFMIFTDSMQVPVGAPHAFTAQKMMDFVYRPEIQAAITEYVNYVPPVKGAREIIQKRNPEVAENPLIFPDLSASHNFKTFPEKDEADIEAAFQRAIGA